MQSFFHGDRVSATGRQCLSVAVCCVLTFLAGCGAPARGRTAPAAAVTEVEGAQIGDLTEVPEAGERTFEGYGIVAGLGENGSSECPADLLAYLKRYVRIMMPSSGEDPEAVIRSLDTAVVKVTGHIRPGTAKGGRFDVVVRPIEGSQTRSLAGGRLYTTELMPQGRALTGRAVATAAGPVFIDTLAAGRDDRTGYVLAGGQTSEAYPFILTLKKPDYRVASAVRNRIIERYGSGTAVTVNEGVITLNPPKRFADKPEHFVALVQALYLEDNSQWNLRRASLLVNNMFEGQDRARAEAALIGLGRVSGADVAKLLTSPDEEVRLRAAKVMLSYRAYEAIGVLRKILYDRQSQWRTEAFDAIAEWAPAEQTVSAFSGLVDEPDPDLRLAAVEQLLRCGSHLVERQNIGGKFFLDVVASDGPAMIYAARRGAPRIVLFGRGMIVDGDVFVTTADGSVTVDGRSGSRAVNIVRGRRGGTGVVGRPLQTTRLVEDIIRTMSSTPIVEGQTVQLTGLDVAYSDTLEVLSMLCEKGNVKAKFMAGPMAQFQSQ